MIRYVLLMTFVIRYVLSLSLAQGGEEGKVIATTTGGQLTSSPPILGRGNWRTGGGGVQRFFAPVGISRKHSGTEGRPAAPAMLCGSLSVTKPSVGDLTIDQLVDGLRIRREQELEVA